MLIERPLECQKILFQSNLFYYRDELYSAKNFLQKLIFT